MKKVCEYCNEEFTTAYQEQRFCSTQCFGKSRRNPAKCPVCGQEFTPNRARNQIYCSTECYLSTTGYPKACEQCGNKFTAKRPSTKYCSVECSAKTQRNRITIACEQCGKKFRVPKSQKHRRFCSEECFQASLRITLICEKCKKPFDVPKSKKKRRFCSRKCFDEYRNTPAWKEQVRAQITYSPNAQNYRGANWDEQREKALKRDGNRCMVCGTKKRVLHVHHIIPFHDFDGDWIAANQLLNLISLCNSCHRKVELGVIPCPQPLL